MDYGKEANWQFKLTIKLLKPDFESMKLRYAQLPLLQMKADKVLTISQTLEFISVKLNQLNIWLSDTGKLITHELMDAWNVEDEELKEEAVTNVCMKLINASRALLDWEESVAAVIPAKSVKSVYEKMYGTTSSLQQDLLSLIRDLEYVLNVPEVHGELSIKMPFRAPKNLSSINEALAEFSKSVYKNITSTPDKTQAKTNEETIAKAKGLFDSFRKK